MGLYAYWNANVQIIQSKLVTQSNVDALVTFSDGTKRRIHHKTNYLPAASQCSQVLFDLSLMIIIIRASIIIWINSSYYQPITTYHTSCIAMKNEIITTNSSIKPIMVATHSPANL